MFYVPKLEIKKKKIVHKLIFVSCEVDKCADVWEVGRKSLLIAIFKVFFLLTRLKLKKFRHRLLQKPSLIF